MAITVREIGVDDQEIWADMRFALWPEQSREDHLRDITNFRADAKAWAFMAERDGRPVGFAEVQIRPFANSCTETPVAFLEGIWVAPEARRREVGRQLIAHIGAFVKAKGFRELCSDALIDNTISHAAHESWGFAETERVVYFRKPL